ncbi:MAG TPA: hypothetical protein VHS31_09760 [Tepidisphaeraceae bacterium]|jgi:hypothetical protein|nr:hypothetical protein [Tepidisphaeraceae bacterium]
MFQFLSRKKAHRAVLRAVSQTPASSFGLEPLEGRQLLSASHSALLSHHHRHSVDTIQFSQAPAAVQTGLDTDATSHSLTDPAATDTVYLNNVNGVETYSVRISSSGAVTTLTVDQLGDAVTAPTTSTTTFGALSGTSAATEISAIATALGLTAPASSTSVLSTTSNGTTTYSIRLKHSSTSANKKHPRGVVITVDANGNPVGNENITFSVLPSAIQGAINGNLPSGATALTSDSTQSVRVRTVDGVVLYSTDFTVNGTTSTVTVNAAGDVAGLPTQTTTTFGALSSTVQTSLQTLATANGVSGTIADTQSIDVYTEANGAVLYSATLTATSSTDSTSTFDITITVDSDGDPTTLPRRDLFVGRRGRGFGRGGGGCDGGSSSDDGSDTGDTGSTGSTSSGSTDSGSTTVSTLSFRRRR